MFHMNQNMKVVLAVEPVDLRKSFNGLYTIAQTAGRRWASSHRPPGRRTRHLDD